MEKVERMDSAKKIFDIVQYNYKVIANSFYGVSGTNASRFYLPQIAISITLMGQEMIMTCKQVLTDNGFKILYSDTDSTFIDLSDKVPKGMSTKEAREYIYKEVIPKIYEVINPELDKLAKKWNIKDSRLDMKQEVIGKKIIFFLKRDRKKNEVLSAKKRYIAHIIDTEGVETDDLMIRGLEIRRSELSTDVKDRIKKIYEYIIYSDDDPDTIKSNIINMIQEYKKYILSKINEIDLDVISININIKNLSEYKGNTPQYRGLLFYNIVADMYSLPGTESVTKAKMVYVKVKKGGKLYDYLEKEMPEYINPTNGSVEYFTTEKVKSIVIPTDFKDMIPDTLFSEDLEIDAETMVNRLFTGPLTPIIDLFEIDENDIIL